MTYRVYLIEFLLTNYTLINFRVVRATSLKFDLNIDTSRTIVGRIFHFSSSNPTPRFGLVHNRSNKVDVPRKSVRWTLYNTDGPLLPTVLNLMRFAQISKSYTIGTF